MKIKKFIKNNIENIIILIVSVVAFIVGFFSIGWLKALIIIGSIDLLLYVPIFIMKLKGKKKHKTEHKSESKGEKVKKVKTKKEKKTKKDKKSRRKKIVNIILITIMSLCILCILGVFAFMLYISNNAPKFNPDNLYQKESTIVYDINGVEKARLGLQRREAISYDELPQILIDAIVATEDSNYFNHDGVDWSRFLVASVKQVLGSSNAGGASTITMQISKNAFTSKVDTGIQGIIRKFTDIYVSLNEIEPNYTKEEIMEFYVNSYYLGNGTYGVEQACQSYFGKSVSEINVAEAAMIAGLFKGGSAYDPTLKPEQAEQRRQVVLKLMNRHGYITEEEYKIAKSMNITSLLNTKSVNEEDLYRDFIDTVVQEVREDTGDDPYSVPMEIYTTMDSAKQEYMLKIMNGEAGFTWPNENTQSGIAVIKSSTGEISAIGAGRNRNGEMAYNRATQISRQIGSTSKPLYDYAPAIEYNNWSTYSLLVDEPHGYSNNGPKINNWDMQYYGLVTARTALATSRNIPALKTFQAVSKQNIKDFVSKLELHPEYEGGTIHEAHSIGGYTGENPVSLAAAYTTFANGGVYNTPHSYKKIVYRESGKVVEKEVTSTRVMSPETAYMVYNILQDAGRYGLGSSIYSLNGIKYGAKTGTSNFTAETKAANNLPSNAINDYWVAGVNPDYAIAVWLGYDKISEGYNIANTIYHKLLFKTVAQGVFTRNVELPKPNGVTIVQVEFGTHPAQRPSEFTPKELINTELFKAGTEPTEVSTRYSQLSNVTDLKSTVKDNVLTLSWTPIKTPQWLDETYLNSYFDSLYSDPATKEKAKQERNEYNKNSIGTITYDVYSKDSKGELKFIETTDENSFEIKLNSSSPTTYVVKTSYTIFTANMSSGVSTTISLDGVEDEIEISLKGDLSVTIDKGSYVEPGVKVIKNKIDVTKDAKITTIYKDSYGKEVKASDIKADKSTTYTATYTITYGKINKTLTRRITTKKETTNYS